MKFLVTEAETSDRHFLSQLHSLNSLWTYLGKDPLSDTSHIGGWLTTIGFVEFNTWDRIRGAITKDPLTERQVVTLLERAHERLQKISQRTFTDSSWTTDELDLYSQMIEEILQKIGHYA